MKRLLRIKISMYVRLYRLLEKFSFTLPPGVFYIGGSETLPPPMSREEEAHFISLLMYNSVDAKQALIERNLRLVVYIARRFETRALTSRTSSPSAPSASSRPSIHTTRKRTSSSPPTPRAASKTRS
jgi:RNA polymerase sporulation-specific sigma factor